MDADRCVIAISNVRPVPIQSLPKFLSSFTNVDGVATRTGNQVDEGTGLASEMAMDWSRFRLQLNPSSIDDRRAGHAPSMLALVRAGRRMNSVIGILACRVYQQVTEVPWSAVAQQRGSAETGR